MKLMKRATALLLCFLMLTNGPISAFATEGVSDNDVVVETTTTTEIVEVCEECGGSDAHTDTCSFNTISTLNTETTDETTQPTTVPTEAPAETTQPTTTPTETPDATVSGNDVGCAECGQAEGHLDTCSQYVDPNACAECGQTEGHLEDCSQYVIPAVEVCTECGQAEGHLETCSQYVAPTEEAAETDDPQVGDKIWIKSDSKVYKNHANVEKDYYKLKGSYEVEIVGILVDENGNAEWYEFKFLNLGVGELFLSIGGYKYVHVDNTSVEEPEDTEPSDSEKETTVGDIALKVQGVPESVTLGAETVAPKAWNEAVFDAVGNHKVVFAIDITLTGENGAWQPDEGQSVTVSLDAASLGLADGDRIGILHDHNGTLGDLGIYTVTDGKLSFTTDGFSVFYGYTVDFEYDGTWYSIGGGGIILLSELFDALHIDKSVYGVSNVVFSNTSLISVSYENVGSYVPEYDWILRSLEPFDTEETLTVSFADGEVLEIKVYDANYTSLTDGMTLNNGDALNGTISVTGNVSITVNGTVTLNGNITVAKNATLTINGTGTIKRGSSNTGAMFTVSNGGKLNINAITIDGAASWTATTIDGSTRRTLSVSGVQAQHTAIYSAGGATITLSGTTMQNLYTTKNGAGIHTLGTVGNADGIAPSNVTLNNVTVKKCASTSDNSILLLNYSYATLNNCTFTDNYAGYRYAGVIKAGGPSNFCLLKMNGCTATGNYSSGWGGVILWAANTAYNGTKTEAIIDNCTFTNNTARYLGGAISNEAIMTVSNCTITGNTAMSGGGIATFPYTRSEDDELADGNACGLTLGTGNTISGNHSVATGTFKPFSSEGSGANQDETGTTIPNIIEYTGGGGGVWCYMNKSGWNCGLEIGTGNTIADNDAINIGGGVLVEHVAGNVTELKITGAKVTENGALHGGGVAVIKATVSIESGEITSNTATSNGGGIYVNNGTCTVSGTGTVSNNTAANGGGIYINSGSLTVNGGIITGNCAKGENTVNVVVTDKTAYQLNSGVGGGIYVNAGTFVMSGDAASIGIYGNLADFAADDAYASGDNTTLTLPDVSGMKLDGSYANAEGWFADYVSNDTKYASVKPFTFDNNGRYRTDENVDNLTGAITAGKSYYCLTLGRIPALTITKVLTKQPESSFMFTVSGPNNFNITVTIPASAFELKDGKYQASITLTRLSTGEYQIVELTDWSWRYSFKGAVTENDKNYTSVDNGVQFTLTTDGEEAIFTNTRTENKWLSGDCYAENWWDNNGNVVRKDDDED